MISTSLPDLICVQKSYLSTSVLVRLCSILPEPHVSRSDTFVSMQL